MILLASHRSVIKLYPQDQGFPSHYGDGFLCYVFVPQILVIISFAVLR